MRDLIIKARKDEEARLKILRSYEPLIKKCIRMYVKDFNYHNDALQQGYLVLLECIYKYNIDGEYHFGAYLKVSLIYAMRNFAKKIKNDLSLDEEFGEDGGTLIDTIEGSENVEESIIKRENMKSLYEAYNKLSDSHKKIIDEVYFKNISMIDICKGRRCHYMAVVKMKDRALKSLRDYMK